MQNIVSIREKFSNLVGGPSGAGTINFFRRLSKKELEDYVYAFYDLCVDLELFKEKLTSSMSEYDRARAEQLLQELTDKQQELANIKTFLQAAINSSWPWWKFWKAKPIPYVQSYEDLSSKLSSREQSTISVELEKIEQERIISTQEQDSHQTAGKTMWESFTIIVKSMVHAFIRDLNPPLLSKDIQELQKKRDLFEVAQAVRVGLNLYNDPAQSILRIARDFMPDLSVGLLDLDEEKSSGNAKNITLILGWALILAIKLMNVLALTVKHCFCIAKAVFSFFDKGFEHLIGEFQKDHGALAFTAKNCIQGIAYAMLRGPCLLAKGLMQIGATASRWLERNIDADRWLRYPPVKTGLALAGFGAIILLGLISLNVISFGIPMVSLIIGGITATIGVLIRDHVQRKTRTEELHNLRLHHTTVAKLANYEATHAHANMVLQSLKELSHITTRQANQALQHKLLHSLQQSHQTDRKIVHDVLSSDRGINSISYSSEVSIGGHAVRDAIHSREESSVRGPDMSSRSFSLVELMVVVAIIGVLSAIAVPSYQAYIARSRVADALTIADSMKTTILEFYDTHSALPTNEIPLVYDPSTNVSLMNWQPFYSSVEIWLNKSNVPMLTSNYPIIWYTLSISSNGVVQWTCHSHSVAGYQVPCKVLPSNCQDANCTN